jgi:transcriptional regulator with XRE-family HTH domain
MISDITPENLKKWRKEKRLTQTQFGKRVNLDKFAVTNIEHEKRKISAPEQLLFKHLLLGELPFPVRTKLNELNFTQAEWKCIGALSIRKGFRNPNDWISDQIKSYLAQIPVQTLPSRLHAAESSAKYPGAKKQTS